MAVYRIIYEDDYDVTNGHSSFACLAMSCDEKVIFDIYNNPKNKSDHPDMIIERFELGVDTRWDKNRSIWTNS